MWEPCVKASTCMSTLYKLKLQAVFDQTVHLREYYMQTLQNFCAGH